MYTSSEIDTLKRTLDKEGYLIFSGPSSTYVPQYAYTVGLWRKFYHPELIVFGLAKKQAKDLLHKLSWMVSSGKKWKAGEVCDSLEGKPYSFLYTLQERLKAYTQRGQLIVEDFPALQLVWSDKTSKSPWRNSFKLQLQFQQPLLDRDPAFHFLEARSQGVFIDRKHPPFQHPVLFVKHHTNGQWYFLPNDRIEQTSLAVESLEKVVRTDYSLNEVFGLDYGKVAYRVDQHSPWNCE